MSVLIKGGRIVTATDDYVGDVYVENGAVSLIGEALDVSADKVVDAAGKVVMPGAIDPHTHLEMAFGGTVTCDDFTSGTVSAAFGGTTMPDRLLHADAGRDLPRGAREVPREDRSLRSRSSTSASTSASPTSHDGGTLDDLAKLPDEGVTSYKLFMAYKGAVMVDDETLFRTMQVAVRDRRARHGARRERRRDRRARQGGLAEGKTEPIWHARTRPPITEGEATNRAIQLARVAGCPLYVVHVSCKEAIEPIARARAEGWQAWGETCTQYLFIDETALAEAELRGRASTSTRRRRGRRSTRSISGRRSRTTCSRSSRPTTAPSTGTARRRSARTTSRRSRTAVRGSRTVCTCCTTSACARVASRGTASSSSSRRTLRARSASTRARARSRPGSDADIVVFDPEKRLTISAATHHSNVDYNLYEGTEVIGAPEVVLVRGQTIVEDDELVAEPGAGRFVSARGSARSSRPRPPSQARKEDS